MAPTSSVESRRFITSVAWIAAAAVLLALRLPRLAGPLDDPHSWRQCDTYFYSLSFFRNGIDLLRPSVSWLGAHGTLIFEFPLPEALSALLYHAFGPDPMWDRVVTFGFFVMATGYLHAFVRRFASARVAALATLAYLALPLGQYYSRAPQVDFAATAFAHAFAYHALVGLQRHSFRHGFGAAAFGVLAAMIKGPYLIPLLGPLAVAFLIAPGVAPALIGGLAVGLPAVAFVLWRKHVDAVNSAAPDWDFLPGYYKESNALWWYFGSWGQRFDAASWMKLARRVVNEIATPLGVLIAAVALVPRRDPEGRLPTLAFALAWAAATLAYLLVFFPLNVIHNYYQVPFLAPAALLIGLGADSLWQRLPTVREVPAGGVVFAGFLVVAAWAVVPLGYYRVDWLRVEAGRLISSGLPAEDLLVVSDHGAGYSDPRLLVRADRRGWALAATDLERDRLERLSRLGARWVAVVSDPEHPEQVPPAYLERGSVGRYPVLHRGERLGTLSLYDLPRALGGESLAVKR